MKKAVTSPVGLIILLFLLITGCNGLIAYGTEDTVTFTVRKTEERVQSDGESISSKRLVYTDKGTYMCGDSIWYGQFRSSDTYGEIEKGKTYKAKITGFRFGCTSSYPNIIEIEEVR